MLLFLQYKGTIKQDGEKWMKNAMRWTIFPLWILRLQWQCLKKKAITPKGDDFALMPYKTYNSD
jgi:hypothetical protein